MTILNIISWGFCPDSKKFDQCAVLKTEEKINDLDMLDYVTKRFKLSPIISLDTVTYPNIQTHSFDLKSEDTIKDVWDYLKLTRGAANCTYIPVYEGEYRYLVDLEDVPPLTFLDGEAVRTFEITHINTSLDKYLSKLASSSFNNKKETILQAKKVLGSMSELEISQYLEKRNSTK